jgi:hypothetical protein
MASITPGVVTPVGGVFNTNPSYSGTFIPTLWSAKLNAKFYTASTFADICNRDWEGDVKNLGDKVIINNIPTMTIREYVVGANLQYETPTPNTIELAVDRAFYYGFNVADVLEYQAKPDLMNMFTNDAAEQMRTRMDSTCLIRTLLAAPSGSNEDGVVAANAGATAGKRSAALDLGTDTAPVNLGAADGSALELILRMASVLDEQNVPDTGRWLLLDPVTRLRLMKSNLAQAQFMGDDKSMIRNGMIGTIDRFKVYVTNHLPARAANAATWASGDASETVAAGGQYAGAASRILAAGHTSAITFASQITKTEQLRNPTDFGDLVRGMQLFGHKVVKGTALTRAVVYG